METVTVGICAHEEEDTVGQLLEQVKEEDIPVSEAIVVVAGEDRTAEIVSDKAGKYPWVELVEEGEREGQVAAQNKIIDRATGDLVLFLDGDGLIEPGSLERIYSEFDGEAVLSGKEIPVTGEDFLGSVIDKWSDVHHRFCLDNARFSTHLGLVPSDLIHSFPEIVLDDAFIENRARKEGFSIRYIEDAVKRHHMPDSWTFFFHQQKKNWAGRFQADARGIEHSKPENLLLEAYLGEILDCPVRELPAMFVLGAVELFAYLGARKDSLREDFPVMWHRPSGPDSEE